MTTKTKQDAMHIFAYDSFLAVGVSGCEWAWLITLFPVSAQIPAKVFFSVQLSFGPRKIRDSFDDARVGLDKSCVLSDECTTMIQTRARTDDEPECFLADSVALYFRIVTTMVKSLISGLYPKDIQYG